jgi:hypothetical protein
MIKLTQHKTKNDLHSPRADTTDHLSQLLSEFDAEHRPKILRAKIEPAKERRRKFDYLKRLSPFFMLAIILPFSLLWLTITTDYLAINKFAIGSLLLFAEINLLFTDFVLWNYFEGKRRLIIWIIELCCILVFVEYFIWKY